MAVAEKKSYINELITTQSCDRLKTTGLMLREDGLMAESDMYMERYREQRKHLDALAQLKDQLGPSLYENEFIRRVNWLISEGWTPPKNWDVQTITETLEDESED